MRLPIAFALVSAFAAACATWTADRVIETRGSVLGKKALNAEDECLWSQGIVTPDICQLRLKLAVARGAWSPLFAYDVRLDDNRQVLVKSRVNVVESCVSLSLLHDRNNPDVYDEARVVKIVAATDCK